MKILIFGVRPVFELKSRKFLVWNGLWDFQTVITIFDVKWALGLTGRKRTVKLIDGNSFLEFSGRNNFQCETCLRIFDVKRAFVFLM